MRRARDTRPSAGRPTALRGPGQPCELGFNLRGMLHWGPELSDDERAQLWGNALAEIHNNYGGSVMRIYVAHNLLDADTTARRLQQFLDTAGGQQVRVIAALVDYYWPSSEQNWYVPASLQQGYTDEYWPDQKIKDAVDAGQLPKEGQFYHRIPNAKFFASGYKSDYLSFVSTIVAFNAGHDALYAWEPGNELALRVTAPDDPAARRAQFLRFMKATVAAIRKADPARPIAAGVQDSQIALGVDAPEALYGGGSQIDIATIHHYPPSADEPRRLQEAAKLQAMGRQFIVEELGVPGAVIDPREVIASQLALWDEAGAAAILLWGWPIFPGAEDNYTERWTHESVDQVAAVIRDFPA